MKRIVSFYFTKNSMWLTVYNQLCPPLPAVNKLSADSNLMFNSHLPGQEIRSSLSRGLARLRPRDIVESEGGAREGIHREAARPRTALDQWRPSCNG